jgi:hypothetical protein
VKKLRLEAEELKVETFAVAESDVAQGTVRGLAPDTRVGDTCVTQCATGPCECVLTDPGAC